MINLAEVRNKVRSVADCFHFKYCINKLLCLSLASKLRSSRQNLEDSEKTNDSNKIEIAQQKHAKNQFHVDFYAMSMNKITHILHPYFDGNQVNDSQKAKEDIEQELYNIKTIIEEYDIKDKYKLLNKAHNQVEDLVGVLDEWNKITDSKIENLCLTDEEKKWFKNKLLPKTYWKYALTKTKYKPTRELLKKELLKCDMIPIKKPENLNKQELEKLKNEAKILCRKFQRTSSRVEGRNGYLSMINHNQRGFDQNRLKTLTIIHNFDIYGLDGKTPAQRLFGNKIKHDKIIDYLIQNFDDLPLPRRGKMQPIDH